MNWLLNSLKNVISNENLISAVLGAIIGGIATFASEKHFRNSDNKEQEIHFASMLYYDLKSIEDYLINESSSVDIRYSTEWQKLVANCSFLKTEYIENIYKIYDYVYNFDFLYKKSKEQGTSNRKEDQPAYKGLKENLMSNKNSTYTSLMKELTKKISI